MKYNLEGLAVQLLTDSILVSLNDKPRIFFFHA